MQSIKRISNQPPQGRKTSMTTTVIIAVQGNKPTKLTTPQGEVTLQPGSFGTFFIHGDQTISVKEVDDLGVQPQGGGGPSEPPDK